MNTNRSFRIIVVLFVIAILASMLSACSGNAAQDAVNLIVSASSDGSKPASSQMVRWSPRTQGCGISESTLLQNTLGADLKTAGQDITELSISTDEWLNNHMGSFTCIKAVE